MRTLLMSALLLSTGLASAQQINKYRYWFDDNVASGISTTVVASDELVLNTMLPTGSMAPGYHRISMQVRDSDGNWSVPRTNIFVRTNGLVNGFRYWLNDDPTTLVTAAVTATATLNLANDLAMGNLTRNFNWVTFQFKETDGGYSVPKTQAFVRGTGAVNGYEYWIDDAIEDRVTNAIGPNAVVDLIADLPMNTTPGDHLFTVRFSSMNGTWSVPITTEYSFFIGIEEMPGVSNVLLFPNPATDQLGLRLSSDGQRMLHMEVLNLAGQRIMDLEDWSVQGSTWRNWDISGLAVGTYLLRMTSEKGARNIPFVKH
ncbi:MAG: T9SS type A sorting domain-containing protein [Flavobacteriales bacterium]